MLVWRLRDAEPFGVRNLWCMRLWAGIPPWGASRYKPLNALRLQSFDRPGAQFPAA